MILLDSTPLWFDSRKLSLSLPPPPGLGDLLLWYFNQVFCEHRWRRSHSRPPLDLLSGAVSRRQGSRWLGTSMWSRRGRLANLHYLHTTITWLSHPPCKNRTFPGSAPFYPPVLFPSRWVRLVWPPRSQVSCCLYSLGRICLWPLNSWIDLESEPYRILSSFNKHRAFDFFS